MCGYLVLDFLHGFLLYTCGHWGSGVRLTDQCENHPAVQGRAKHYAREVVKPGLRSGIMFGWMDGTKQADGTSVSVRMSYYILCGQHSYECDTCD